MNASRNDERSDVTERCGALRSILIYKGPFQVQNVFPNLGKITNSDLYQQMKISATFVTSLANSWLGCLTLIFKPGFHKALSCLF